MLDFLFLRVYLSLDNLVDEKDKDVRVNGIYVMAQMQSI